MIKITSLLIILFTFFQSLALAEDIKSNALNSLSEGISGAVSNLIPGEGDTEVSIDIRENYKPDYSLLFVRELMENQNQKGNLFTQFSIFNTEKLNNETLNFNLGLGKRFLSDDKLIMTGLNTFVDTDTDGNIRSSLGAEIKNSVLGFNSNYYVGIEDSGGEKVLDGYDLQLNSQIPYLHWADAFINTYEWEGRDRADIKGTKLGTELQITPSLSIEAAHDDKDKKGLEDEYFVNLVFTYPPSEGPSAINDGISSNMWKEERDMSGELLKKVKRNNKIVVEFKGTSTISRTD